MTLDISKSSLVQWFEGAEKHKCGYCKNESSLSNGMWAMSLTVEDYQDLIDRGWRRSGKYCYKSIMERTCCPLYTIKCDVVNFSLSKSQKKVIKKLNKFLRDGELNSKDNLSNSYNEDEGHCDIIHRSIPNVDLKNLTESIQCNEDLLEKPSTSKHLEQNNEQTTSKQKEISCDKEYKESSHLNSNIKQGVGMDPNKVPCKKAKLLRIERKKEKALKAGIIVEKTQTPLVPKSLEEFLEEGVSEENKVTLKIRLIATSIQNSDWKAAEKTEFELYKKYQIVIHNDPPSKLNMDGFKRFLVESPLKVKLEQMTPTHKYFALSAELYKKYQMTIHNDSPQECDEEQFNNFLVETPLQPKPFPNGVEGPGYGSFHQQYWFKDKLIAVGVIDILPKCVSSVYFFYDPDYRSLTLGTYGSLREIYYARKLQKILPELNSYYMGFYIHSCPKMRYKGKLKPSYLVCPETYEWVPIEMCLPLLETNKYSRLNNDLEALDDNVPSDQDVLKTLVCFQYQLMNYHNYRKIINEDEKYKEIGNLVGKKCLKNLIFIEPEN